jgi:dienelactone hydrolase
MAIAAFRSSCSSALSEYLTGVVFALQLLGCAGPSQRWESNAEAFGYDKVVVSGHGFDHAAYLKQGIRPGHPVLHVYLEGDGTPWIRRRLAARDPTPRNPVVLDLMALDQAPSVLLGRPCYHGLSQKRGCTPDLWTTARYSETVVESMAAALSRLAAGYQSLVLIGFSGGGTLAMLLAERTPKTWAVVTLSGNLDTARWAILHQEEVSDSLNPAARSPLLPHIRQKHFAGGKDKHVPPELAKEAIAGQPGAEFRIFQEFDHVCCWQQAWPEILASLAEIEENTDIFPSRAPSKASNTDPTSGE